MTPLQETVSQREQQERDFLALIHQLSDDQLVQCRDMLDRLLDRSIEKMAWQFRTLE
ncbi:MAG: hypothetical protein ACOYJY_02155 [Acutalibacteraceae bacterium]|jgi:hypothetical protein